jgi:hypothetical protein
MDLAEFVFWILIVCTPVLVMLMAVAIAYPSRAERELDQELWGSQDVDQRKIK